MIKRLNRFDNQFGELFSGGTSPRWRSQPPSHRPSGPAAGRLEGGDRRPWGDDRKRDDNQADDNEDGVHDFLLRKSSLKVKGTSRPFFWKLERKVIMNIAHYRINVKRFNEKCVIIILLPL